MLATLKALCVLFVCSLFSKATKTIYTSTFSSSLYMPKRNCRFMLHISLKMSGFCCNYDHDYPTVMQLPWHGPWCHSLPIVVPLTSIVVHIVTCPQLTQPHPDPYREFCLSWFSPLPQAS